MGEPQAPVDQGQAPHLQADVQPGTRACAIHPSIHRQRCGDNRGHAGPAKATTSTQPPCQERGRQPAAAREAHAEPSTSTGGDLATSPPRCQAWEQLG